MSAFPAGTWVIESNPRHLEEMTDAEVLRDALRKYRRGSVPAGSSEFYVHPEDMAEYRRRADVAESMLAALEIEETPYEA
jgi:hypothetical protein